MFVYLVWAGVNAFPKYHLAKVFNRPSFCIGCAEVKAREISLQRMNRIDVTYIGTEDQLADMLTKPLPRPRLEDLRGRIGVVLVKDSATYNLRENVEICSVANNK